MVMPPAAAPTLVVAYRHEPAGDPAVAPHHDHQHRQHEHAQGEPGEGSFAVGSDDPNNDGASMSVDCGLGRPVHTSRCTIGIVQHEVASTVGCMNSAKPRVLTARYRPADPQRGQSDQDGDHCGDRAHRRAAARPAAGSSRGGWPPPRPHRPGRTDRARPDRAQPVSTVSDSAITAKMHTCDIRYTCDRCRAPAGSATATATTSPMPPRRTARRWRSATRAVVIVPSSHDDRSSVRAPFCSVPTRTSRMTSSIANRMSSTVALFDDVVVEDLLDDADRDAGHERHRQVDHGTDQRGGEGEQQQVGAQHVGQRCSSAPARRGWR